MSDELEPLNDRQRKFVSLVARGESVHQAAKLAGFSPSYARKSSRLLKQPMIAKAIATIQEQGRTIAAYGLVDAMKEADAVCAFAKKHKNAMAYCKGTELRAKLSGLLVDRVEVVTVDLTGALQAARLRVITPRTDEPPGLLSDDRETRTRDS